MGFLYCLKMILQGIMLVKCNFSVIGEGLNGIMNRL